MHIITVYPLAKGMRAEQLSYYYAQPIRSGVIVSVPMGNRTIRAVVADSHPAEQKRAEIRSAEYELKPVKMIGRQPFYHQFISAAQSFARFSGVTTGATLRALTPQVIRANTESIPEVRSDYLQSEIGPPPPSIIQAPTNQRRQYIHSLLQSRISDNRSVFVCAPTIAHCNQLADLITSHPTVTLHSGLSKSVLLESWRTAVETDEPLVLVGTPVFLSVPRSDLGQIIITQEGDPAYKMAARPFLDKRLFARRLAREFRQPCTLSDRVLPIETLWAYKDDQMTAEHKPEFRYERDLKTQLIDMTEQNKTDSSGVHVFSPPVAQLVRSAETNGEHTLLFVARSGRRPFTACSDCGTVVTCQNCDLPLVLVEKDNQRQYICRTCNRVETSEKRCDNCGGWRLKPLGIGTDFVADILSEHIAEQLIYQIDGDTHASPEAVSKTLENFYQQDGGVLVTTKLGVNHFTSSVTNSGIVTADALLAIPDLSISEELFSLLLAIREHTQKRFLIQTRSQQTTIFEQALAGHIEDFYDTQISRREQFEYPPFTYLIKLSVNGSKQNVTKHMNEIGKKLDAYSPQIYPDRSSKHGRHALLRIDRDNWIDDDLLQKLCNLPPAVSINAHPRSLL